MSNDQELFGNADVGSLINFGLSIKNVEGPKKRITHNTYSQILSNLYQVHIIKYTLYLIYLLTFLSMMQFYETIV